MSDRYPKRATRKKPPEEAPYSQAANGGGKKKKHNDDEAKGQLTVPAAKGNKNSRPKGKYTNEQWKQKWGETRCVLLKDEDLTREMIESMVYTQLSAVSASRSIRLAVNPKKFQNGTKISGGGGQTERIRKNLNEYLNNPTNAARGSNAAGTSDLHKAMVADGKASGLKNSVDGNGTHLYKVVNLGDDVDEDGDPLWSMIYTDQYEDSKGKVCTALTISPSEKDEIDESDGMNASRVICDAIGLGYDSLKNCTTENTKATSKLRAFLVHRCGMKMDENCKSGHGNNQYTSAGDRSFGWENRGMKFYFKGTVSDITRKQTTVKPAEPPE